MTTAAEVDQMVLNGVAGMTAYFGQLTAPDGPFPLAEEDVKHFGTTQRYLCWQNGPNSLVQHTLPEFYGDCFLRFADQEFLVYERERMTYGQAISAAAAFSRELNATYGVTRGSCVAIAGRNHPDWIISLLAATGFLSAMALPVNSWWRDEELRYGLDDSKAMLLIADAFVLERAPFLNEMGVKAICMRAGSSAPPGGAGRFEDIVEAGRRRDPMPMFPAAPDDRAMLMYTSGTTNKPKGVVMTHRSILAALNMIRMLNYTLESKPQYVSLLGSPLFHVNGTHVALLASISKGSKLVLMPKWNATNALELVQQEKVVGLTGVPTMTYDLVNHPDFDKYDTSTLVGVGGGGAAFSAPMIKRVADKFKKAKAGTGYGLTETNAINVIMPPDFFPARPSSCGRAVPNVSLCILDDNNKKKAIGEMGEICIRGAVIMQEYWGKPDKTAEVFHVDEEGKLWFRSGDLGRLDENGFLYIMDRAKDIIIRGGENISCAEVEGALFDHPSVAEVAAVGAPHETLGETVVVVIVYKAGTVRPTFEEIRKHAADRLSNYKVPSEFLSWEGTELPRGATGKIQKRDIREKLGELRNKAPPSKL